VRTRKLYLPRSVQGWFDWWTGAHHGGGQTIEVAAPLHRLPLFVRGGALVPTTDTPADRARTEEASRALLWFPGADSDATTLLYEDDGLQATGTADRFVVHRFNAEARGATLRLAMTSEGSWVLPYRQVRVVLPAGEKRKVELTAAAGVALVA
jgi:alpha-glucosidase (family GH31 glycosyl hydrolase)